MTEVTGVRYAGPGSRDYQIAQLTREVMAWVYVDEPKRGGTYLYCPDAGCTWRTRDLAKYRRHWRRYHLEESNGTT